MVVLGMGKFGGREMNYHSDLDIVFLFEADGQTVGEWQPGYFQPAFLQRAGTADHQDGQPPGRVRQALRSGCPPAPTGKSGALAVSRQEFTRYFAEGAGQLWERQALCKARPVCGSIRAIRSATAAVHRAAFGHRWRRKDAEEIQHMRARLEETAAAGDLKRGPGGIVDIEFLVQMMQLQHARKNPRLRAPNTLAVLAELHTAGLLGDDDYRFFDAQYRFLRTIEGRLRLLNSTARDTLPHDADRAEQAGAPVAVSQQRRPDGGLRRRHPRDPPPIRADAGGGGRLAGIGEPPVFRRRASNWKARKPGLD